MKPIIVDTINKYKNYKIFILNFENQKKLIKSILYPFNVNIITNLTKNKKF